MGNWKYETHGPLRRCHWALFRFSLFPFVWLMLLCLNKRQRGEHGWTRHKRRITLGVSDRSRIISILPFANKHSRSSIDRMRDDTFPLRVRTSVDDRLTCIHRYLRQISTFIWSIFDARFFPSTANFDAQNDAMLAMVTISSLILLYFLRVCSPAATEDASPSECDATPAIWTYYPCSFIISPASSSCQQVTLHSIIDQCTNRELTFFWHYPLGNLTLTLKSTQNQSFFLHLRQTSVTKRTPLKSVYHLLQNNAIKQRYPVRDENETIALLSDDQNQCSLKFETSNEVIFDYGIFLRMSIVTEQNKTTSNRWTLVSLTFSSPWNSTKNKVVENNAFVRWARRVNLRIFLEAKRCSAMGRIRIRMGRAFGNFDDTSMHLGLTSSFRQWWERNLTHMSLRMMAIVRESVIMGSSSIVQRRDLYSIENVQHKNERSKPALLNIPRRFISPLRIDQLNLTLDVSISQNVT